MKKLFLALLFSAVLFIGLPFYNVHAMDITYDVPFTAIPDITDLFLGMLSGGQYDLSSVSTLEEAAEQHKNSLQNGYHFLQDFAQRLWNWQVTQAGLGNSSLTQDTDLTIYVSPADLAAYMGYSLKWWERDQIAETIETHPDVNYQIQVDQISSNLNGSYELSYPWYQRYSTNFEIANTALSYFTTNNFNTGAGIIYGSTTLATCYINSSNNTLLLTEFSGNPFGYFEDAYVQNPSTYSYANAVNHLYFDSNVSAWINSNYMPFIGSFTYTSSFNSLSDAINYVAQHFRGVNLYVDGVLWASGADIPDDYISAPDVYGVGNTGIDIFDVFYPGLTQDYGGLSINGFLEWLKGKLGEKDVGLDDLIEDAPDIVIGLDENDQPTIRPITYDDTRPAPIVIDEDVPADPDPDNPTPTPTPDPTTFPLPPLPTFPIPSDIPNANIQHTVLAEIVDATQSVVPDDLMVLIWSTFGLLVVGGLIYILHK